MLCPFCGAPYRQLIPLGTVQVKCPYCGGAILVPEWLGGGQQLCQNHPEKFAVGLCNECGDNYCGSCLHLYSLVGRDVKATLYLCPDCLREKYVEQSNGALLSAFFSFLVGIFVVGFVPAMGIFLFFIAAAATWYGYDKRTKTVTEPTLDQVHDEQKAREKELAALVDFDVDDMHSSLLTDYVTHWGVGTGVNLLENEINAYTRHGESFSEAVQKIYYRHSRTKKKRRLV